MDENKMEDGIYDLSGAMVPSKDISEEKLRAFFNEKIFPIMNKPDRTENEEADLKRFSDWHNELYGVRPDTPGQNRCITDFVQYEKALSDDMKEKELLQVFYVNRVYPYINDPHLTYKQYEDRESFMNWYAMLYGDRPDSLQNNNCYIKVKQDEKELEEMYLLLRTMKEDCEYFIEYVKGGMSPEEAKDRLLMNKEIEAYVDSMRYKLCWIPDHLSPDWLTHDDLDRALAEMTEVRYTAENSVLLKGIQAKAQYMDPMVIPFLGKFNPEMKTFIVLDEKGMEEAYRRAGFKSMTGCTYEEFSQSGDTMSFVVVTSYDKPGLKLMAAIKDEADERYSEIRLSSAEQAAIINMIEQKLGMSMEGYLATQAANGPIEINGVGAFNFSMDVTTLYIELDVTDEGRYEAINRSGAFSVLSAYDLEAYKESGYKHAVSAIITIDSIEVEVIGDLIDEGLRVPCTDVEKENIKKAVEDFFGEPIEKILSKRSGDARIRERDLFEERPRIIDPKKKDNDKNNKRPKKFELDF